MKVIDLAQMSAPTGGAQKTIAQLQGSIGSVFGGKTEERAQAPLINNLGRSLTNRFTLLRNVVLEDLDVPIPLVLVGPTGIYVIATSTLKGVYRAKDEVLSEMTRSQDFRPVRPNPINRLLLMAKAVEKSLQDKILEAPEINPVLFFANPGTHMDAVRPAVRIVMIDGLERFSSTILQGRVIMDVEDVHHIVELLSKPAQPAAAAESVSKPLPGSTLEPKLTEGLDRVSRRLSLTTPQWILIGAMAFFEVLILIGFIFLILSTT